MQGRTPQHTGQALQLHRSCVGQDRHTMQMQKVPRGRQRVPCTLYRQRAGAHTAPPRLNIAAAQAEEKPNVGKGVHVARGRGGNGATYEALDNEVNGEEREELVHFTTRASGDNRTHLVHGLHS